MHLINVFLLACSSLASVGAAEVKIKGTTISGTTTMVDRTSIDQFKEIPYATRSSKFGKSTFKHYDDTVTKIDAEKARNVCPQIANYGVPKENEGLQALLKTFMDNDGAEASPNCQAVEVYRPSNPSSTNMPVVVYVHGGGMDSGSRHQMLNRANGFFKNSDVAGSTVFVSVGYSLGPWGFWCYEEVQGSETRVVGNVAILDIINALLWVQNNISKFGGNANDVTLIGHSAGAALIHYVQFALQTHEAYGFKFAPFKKLVMMSGTAFLFPPVTPTEAYERQSKVVENAGCGHLETTFEQYKCMEGLSEDKIIEATRAANVVWAPVIDNNIIKGDVHHHVKNDLFLKGVKILFTVTKEDAALFIITRQSIIEKEGIGKLWTLLGHDNLGKEVEEAYGHRKNSFEAAIQSVTEAIFLRHALNIMELYKSKGIDVSLHQFSFMLGQLNSRLFMLKAKTAEFVWKVSLTNAIDYLKIMGAFHGLEQALLFHSTLQTGSSHYTIDNLSTPNQIRDILGPLFDFIKFGVPIDKKVDYKRCNLSGQICMKTILKIFYGNSALPVESNVLVSKAKSDSSREPIVSGNTNVHCNPNNSNSTQVASESAANSTKDANNAKPSRLKSIRNVFGF